MAIKIGHASIDERGKAQGGAAGDQTGKEVCTRTWYSKPWSYVLRAKSDVVAEKMAQACEAGCANNHIGYDQNQRNTLNTQAKKVGYDLSKITVDCETDCSAFMTVCAWAAGVEVPYLDGNAPTTSTMRARFIATGAFDVLTGTAYLNSDKYLRRGDILVAPGKHTVMALEDGENIVAATYTYCTPAVRQLRIGLSGNDVKRLQRELNADGAKLTVDGEFGTLTENAVKLWQAKNGLTADGVFGVKSWAKLLSK